MLLHQRDIGVELIDHFNIDNVCWESDFPHSDTDWPNAPESAAQVLAPLTDEQVAKITHENAMRHYQFDPFATRAKEQCRAAALRAESPDVDTVTRVGRQADERDAARFRAGMHTSGKRETGSLVHIDGECHTIAHAKGSDPTSVQKRFHDSKASGSWLVVRVS